MKVFFDLETMGLNESYCPILEIAAICCEESGEVVDTFHQYINPGRAIPKEIVELTRITDEKVANCLREGAVLKNFLTWLAGLGCTTIVAHNASFDMRFLKGRTMVCGINSNNYLANIEVIDTMKLSREKIKAGKFTTIKTGNGRWSVRQEAVAQALGIEYGAGGAHSAIEDTLVLKEIYFKMKVM